MNKERTLSPSLLLKATCLSSFLLTSCSFGFKLPTTESKFTNDGLLSLSRPIPGASSTFESSGSFLGFMEHTVPNISKPNSVLISRSAKTLTFKDGSGEMMTFPAEGAEHLKAGSFTIEHKQRNPLWYAPDDYFTSRLQVVPEESDGERYRRGALGEMALFFNGETAIHSGPIWSPEVGGVRVAYSDLERLFDLMALGGTVEIR